jgi:hypothetical protein
MAFAGQNIISHLLLRFCTPSLCSAYRVISFSYLMSLRKKTRLSLVRRRLLQDFTPHGNYFNNLPEAPNDVKAAMPRQDGSIAWNRAVLLHNKDLYRRGNPMVRAQIVMLILKIFLLP